MAAFGNVQDMSGVIWECLGMSRGVWGCQGELEGVGGGPKGGVWQSFPLNFLQFQKVTNDILDIFQWTLRSQMSQISKCPTLRVVLGYWEALGEVSELRYKNLLYSSSKRSYCRSDMKGQKMLFNRQGRRIGLIWGCFGLGWLVFVSFASFEMVLWLNFLDQMVLVG